MPRSEWIDISRGIGIILVVYAHLLSSGYHAGLAINARFFALSDSLVYSFHMPLFFFLSGLLVADSYNKRGLRTFLADKIKLFVWPCLFWSMLQACLEMVFASHSFRGGSWWQVLAIPVLPWAQFWFLYALLGMYILYGILRQLPAFSFLFPLVAILLFFFPLPTGLFALNGLSTGLVFFLFGSLAKEYVVPLERICPPPGVTLVLAVCFIGTGLFLFERVIAPTRLTNGSHPLIFLPLSLLGIVCSLGLAHWLSGRRGSRVLRLLGECSLQIYLVHMLAGVAARILLVRLFGIRDPFLHMLAGLGAGLFGPVLLYRLSSKLGVSRLFAWSGRKP